MTPMARKTIHLERALIASIQHEADHRDTTFSKLIRDTLRREFGLLRIEHDGRNRSYREGSVRGRARAARIRKVAAGPA